MALPPRLIGYGAYNLCFDRFLGKPASGGPLLFAALRNGGWPVNLVKVICFRKANFEGIPPARQVTLYQPNRSINTAFIDNLSNLVDQAGQFGFWVQVCIFHYHAMQEGRNTPGVFPESPEFAPDLLEPTKIGPNLFDRLTNFFTINDSARLNEQIKLVRMLGDRLRRYNNVLWEIANEVRIDGGSAADNAAANCRVVPWFRRMASELIFSLQGRPFTIGTSTGSANEVVTFQRARPAGNCQEQAFITQYFDFHGGQWGATTTGFAAAIAAAKSRAQSYDPNAALILNDDGVPPATRTADWVKARAREAFRNKLHYSSKQEYPPGEPLDTLTLDKLREANNEFPV